MNAWARYIKECHVENTYVLTPYLINDDKTHPCAIICPGGGYKMICDSVEGKPIAEYLNSRGVNAFVLRYAFKKRARYPAPQYDLAKAIKELIDNQEKWHIDVSKMSLWGFSAGGHLCATLGYEYKKYDLPKPHTLVLVYPVITLGKHTHRGTKKYLIGSNATKEDIIARSVYPHVTPDYPRTFIWCGNKDRSVPPVNSEMMAAKLEENNIEHKFIKYQNVGHGVGLAIGTPAEGWADEAIKFWLSK